MLSRERRIVKSKDFRRIYRSGRKVKGKLLSLYYFPTRQGITRFGYSISKKVGQAVARNKLKRRLREICRNHLNIFQPGLDVVLVARENAGAVAYDELEAEVLNLGRRGKILVNRESSGDGE